MKGSWAVRGAVFIAGAMTVVRPAVQGGRFIEVYTAEGRTIVVELAVTPEERARGLMFREKILPGQGMLFLFEKEGKPAFWMKNTLVPLDILWLDRDRRIVHIEPDVPPCPAEPCPSYGPGRDALYVLELAAGEAKRYNLKLFDGLRFVLPDRLREFISPRNRRP